MDKTIRELHEKIQKESVFIQDLKNEIHKIIIGQDYVIERVLVGLLSNGHILIEGVPGLAKTLLIKTLSKCIQTKFQRIQFTPDLLPADIIGTLVYNPQTTQFIVKKGPIFANIILADEINRAPAKTQSALLEAMQERQVTIGEQTYKLEEPFLVLATQNPIEQEGTYPLPEAQVDRFMLKIKISYPQKEEEKEILDLTPQILDERFSNIKPIITPSDILKARKIINEIYIDEKLKEYILNIVFSTREPENYNLSDIKQFIMYGASPRASIYLVLAAKCYAFLNHRGYVIPDDIKAMAYDVLRHRIILTYEAEAEQITTDDIIKQILNTIEVP
ncbi:MAG: MoxR family ATPase [Elusimicrobiota bacterium]|nr:MoxR family ATPase [Endomicrobiia bacterium]MDW8165005.1 MoxR family ATPase [Elusimicrobiota bacterium]